MSASNGVSAAEAAATAAAAYVKTQSYKQGVEDGWAAGWAAAFHDNASDDNIQGTSGVVQNDASAAGEPLFELDENWARMFISGAELRKSKRRKLAAQPADVALDTTPLDLGGLSEAKRKKTAQKLYGSAARGILEAEAELTANFNAITSSRRAPLWPVISLRDTEAPSSRGAG